MGYIADLELETAQPPNAGLKLRDRHASIACKRLDRTGWRINHPVSRVRSVGIAGVTPIVPSAIAVAVWEEASRFLKTDLPRSWMRQLVRRAEAVFQHNPRFRSRVCASGNSGRDYLWSFMRHWLSGLVYHHNRSLADRLPATYKIGHSLRN